MNELLGYQKEQQHKYNLTFKDSNDVTHSFENISITGG
jgi:hypothetical protein